MDLISRSAELFKLSVDTRTTALPAASPEVRIMAGGQLRTEFEEPFETLRRSTS
jgi:hypothetical protein